MVEALDSISSIFGGALTSVFQYWWVILLFSVIGIGAALAWWFTKYRQKNSQWTHRLNVKIQLPNGEIDPKIIIFKMRRWKHKDEITAPLFELEKPLIGSRIFVELEKYSGATSYEIVLGNDGRLYLPTKITMSKDKTALEISVKHAGIDRARQEYNNRFEKMNATPSKIDALTLMKYGLYASAIIVVLILGITGLKAWGERASYDAAAAEAEVRSWETVKEVMTSIESVLNTQALIIPDLKILYGNNLQGAIKNQKEALNKT